jgi:hypothetical protein
MEHSECRWFFAQSNVGQSNKCQNQQNLQDAKTAPKYAILQGLWRMPAKTALRAAC